MIFCSVCPVSSRTSLRYGMVAADVARLAFLPREAKAKQK